MFKGYQSGEESEKLKVYLELLKEIETFENSLENSGIPPDILIIFVTRIGLMLEIVNSLNSIDEENKKELSRTVNANLKMLMDIYKKRLNGEEEDGEKD